MSWTRSTDIEQLTRHADVLVVMPEGGNAGFYSNWRSGPAWETFHITELAKLLTEHYRASNRRVIAGVSMGGLGALGYAVRHPGMFDVAASFSGIVDTRLSSEESQAYLGLLQSQGEDPLALWGDPQTNEGVWKAHNPFDLTPWMLGTRLFVSAGNATPGPLDPRGASQDPQKRRSVPRTSPWPSAYAHSGWTRASTLTGPARTLSLLATRVAQSLAP